MVGRFDKGELGELVWLNGLIEVGKFVWLDGWVVNGRRA